MENISRFFHLYRYQIVPTVNDLQLTMLPSRYHILSLDDLITQKNQIFSDVIQAQVEYKHPRAELTHKLYQSKSFFVLKLGANRSLIRITKEFKEEELDNWPSVYVVINNNPSIQLVAVEVDTQAFYRTSTVVNILTINLNQKLKEYDLILEINPLFEKDEFWNIVKSHKNRITNAKFFMVAPNLPDISKNLKLDLEELKKSTNSQKTNMFLQSPKGESLSLTQDDSFINSLVHYASEGGGTIHLKARGIRKTIKTEDSVKTFEIDEVHFTGTNVLSDLVDVLRPFLK